MRDDKDSLHPVNLSEMLTTETNGRTRRVTLHFINIQPNQEGFYRVQPGPVLLFVYTLAGSKNTQCFSVMWKYGCAIFC